MNTIPIHPGPSRGLPESKKETMQKALDVTQVFARQSGLHLSPEKTSFMIATKHRTTRFGKQIQLKIDGTPILKAPHLKILGVTFEQNGGAVTWMKQTKTQWSDGLNLLRKLTMKAWRAQAGRSTKKITPSPPRFEGGVRPQLPAT